MNEERQYDEAHSTQTGARKQENTGRQRIKGKYKKKKIKTKNKGIHGAYK